MKYSQLVMISAYTVPEDGILMINIAAGEIDGSEEIEPCVAVVDLEDVGDGSVLYSSLTPPRESP